MSETYSIEITKDTITPELARRADCLSMERLNAAVGPAVARLTATHLRALGTNKKGWPTTNFYARAAKATNWQPTNEGPLVSINQIGARQRYRGGHIAPVRARALTIPISPVSYGRTASEFPGAFVLKTAKGAYIVQKQDTAEGTPGRPETKTGRMRRMKGMGGNAKRRLSAFLNFLFKLSSGVDQEADPEVLPEKSEIGAVAKEAVLAGLRKK